MESESSSSNQSLTDTFRTEAFALGINGETVARMALSADRALACVQEAVRRGAGPGLAVHMFDAGDWPEKPKPAFATNLHADITNCQTCGGDRFVVVSIRKPVQSTWMQERGLNASTESMYEEYAPCPDCGPDIPGTPDPGRVRQMMNG